MIGPFLEHRFLIGSAGHIDVLRNVDFFHFGCLVVMQQQVIETLQLDLVLKSHYLPVEFIKEDSRVFYDGSVIGGFEGQQRVELLYEDGYEHILAVWVMAFVLNFSSRCSSLSPDPSMVSSL